MTCDELFDLLTDDDNAESGQCRDAMKRHLSGCRSCRRLADALEPAVELFRECSAGEEFTASSLTNGPWSEPEKLIPAWDRSAARTPWMMQVFGGDLLRLAAAILVGLTLGALVWGQDDAAPQARNSAAPRVTLASLLVTAECLPEQHRPGSVGRSLQDRPRVSEKPAYTSEAANASRLRPAAELLASADLAALACCTSCHASLGMASHSKSATLQVVRSCQACHTF